VFSDRAHPVDLNGDVGEGTGQDEELIPLLTSANIACGVHAGDSETMYKTVILARRHGVSAGAHPSYPDREHFGRRTMSLTDMEVEECVAKQILALREIAAPEQVRVRHVKPHGALYNTAVRDRSVADAIARGVARCDPSLVLVGLAGSELIAAGARAGLRTASEVFADRQYQADGRLVPRDAPHAVLHDVSVIVPRAVRMVRDGVVTAIDGREVPLQADTICIHGDTPDAPALASALRLALGDAGIALRALA
jgi:UPF0271 protein